MKNKKVGVVSLGCDKNRVDTEKMLAILSAKYDITSDQSQANVIVINTCAFLESARVEAIDEILTLAEYKKTGVLEKLVVTGCLPQKFVNEMFDELIEVDVFLGISDYDKILKAIELSFNGQRVNMVGVPAGEPTTKRVLTTKGYAYLKIADGCSNKCTYCMIPSIRGAYRSVCPEKLLEEAKALGEIHELILVAQDTTKYGADNPEYGDIVSLIKKLTALENVKNIRLLYCYPEMITDQFIDEIAKNPKVLKYIDVPMQHADSGILKKMNRKGTYESYLELVKKLKDKVPEIAIRSTFITGFPSEDKKAFETLIKFLKKAKLLNAGFFAYSREEGTPAFKMKGQVDEEEKLSRQEKLYEVQKSISLKLNRKEKGKIYDVFVEGFDGASYYGRCYKNAPDIDGKVYFTGREHVYGDCVHVKISGADEYDLYGEEL